MMKRFVSFLGLFTSFGTLLCCALPALFVALGFGAAFAGLVGNIPHLIWLSERKLSLFLFGGALLALGGALQWNSKQLACPVDAEIAAACSNARDWSRNVYFISVGIYLVGAFFAFAAPYFF